MSASRRQRGSALSSRTWKCNFRSSNSKSSTCAPKGRRHLQMSSLSYLGKLNSLVNDIFSVCVGSEGLICVLYLKSTVHWFFYLLDCAQIFNSGKKASGFYMIKPSRSPSQIKVYCDMSEGGGWTVLQRRTNGKESFER